MTTKTVAGPAIGDRTRAARLDENQRRTPDGALRFAASLHGRTEYTITLPPAVLATYIDQDLVDLADRGLGHFGGHVRRDEQSGTALITVYID